MSAPVHGRLAIHVRLEGPGRADTLVLEGERTFVFGRDIACDVVLSGTAISRRHASVWVQDGSLWLRDHSANGTALGERRVRMCTECVGADVRLEIGPYELMLSVAAPIPTDASLRAESLPEPGNVVVTASPPRSVSAEQRRALRHALLESLDLDGLEQAHMSADRLRPRVLGALERITSELMPGLDSDRSQKELIAELCDEVLGLGPLESLLRDPEVSEIMVVDPGAIYVEKAGRLELSTKCFTDDVAVRAVLERIVTPLGRRIDESHPIVDARLPDGSRVNAVIPPLALKGPCITIRKFFPQHLSLARMVEMGGLDEAMARFLERSVRVRVNIVIAGGTGSGKTTLLNALSSAIPERERLITVEDAAELKLAQKHVVSLEARPSNMEGKGAITIRDLVRNALRMRPDRIVVGECRGGEALDMLQAMNTGHEGSMTTIHANSPRETMQRLETLCLMSGLELPLSAVRRQIAASVQVIVQQARFADGTRRVTQVSEVTGLDDRGEVIVRDVFRFSRQGTLPSGEVQGTFEWTGYVPALVERFIAHGLVGGDACW